jgi:hypothetical protein
LCALLPSRQGMPRASRFRAGPARGDSTGRPGAGGLVASAAPPGAGPEPEPAPGRRPAPGRHVTASRWKGPGLPATLRGDVGLRRWQPPRGKASPRVAGGNTRWHFPAELGVAGTRASFPVRPVLTRRTPGSRTAHWPARVRLCHSMIVGPCSRGSHLQRKPLPPSRLHSNTGTVRTKAHWPSERRRCLTMSPTRVAPKLWL